MCTQTWRWHSFRRLWARKRSTQLGPKKNLIQAARMALQEMAGKFSTCFFCVNLCEFHCCDTPFYTQKGIASNEQRSPTSQNCKENAIEICASICSGLSQNGRHPTTASWDVYMKRQANNRCMTTPQFIHREQPSLSEQPTYGIVRRSSLSRCKAAEHTHSHNCLPWETTNAHGQQTKPAIPP